MAFDLYAGDLHESIGHHEEFMFQLLDKDEAKFPLLVGLWHAFYDSPKLTTQQAGELVHELLDLLALNGGADNKALTGLIVRLMIFFSMAYRINADIKCCSD